MKIKAEKKEKVVFQPITITIILESANDLDLMTEVADELEDWAGEDASQFGNLMKEQLRKIKK